jgi:hypothetical protein
VVTYLARIGVAALSWDWGRNLVFCHAKPAKTKANVCALSRGEGGAGGARFLFSIQSLFRSSLHSPMQPSHSYVVGPRYPCTGEHHAARHTNEILRASAEVAAVGLNSHDSC